jgi:hypothetical protein
MSRTAGPPALTGARYAHDLIQVKTLGAAGCTVRTADRTEAAIWWHDRRPAEWEIKRRLAATQQPGSAPRWRGTCRPASSADPIGAAVAAAG